MTVARCNRTVAATHIDAAVAALRAGGLRISAARRLVLEALFAADAPLSAEAIANGVGGRVPRSDLASTYRNLETLEKLGLVRHVHLGHGPGLYALAARGEREYALCETCGSFETVEPPALDAVRDAARAAVGYDVRFTHFPLVGLCPECAERR
jgi:Fur family ferric uptake transcriptional regulator